MNKKKVGLLFVLFGMIVVIASSVVFIINDDDNQNGNNESLENKENEEENSDVCLNDYQNANLITKTTSLNGKNVKLKALSCLDQEELDGNNIKFFSKKDNTYFFEVSILEENEVNYSKELADEYIKLQPTENYTVAIVEDYITENGMEFEVVYTYKKNENDEIIYKDYNMIRKIDETYIIHLRMLTNRQNLEAGFIDIIAESIEIK